MKVYILCVILYEILLNDMFIMFIYLTELLIMKLYKTVTWLQETNTPVNKQVVVECICIFLLL